jgi:hypothetical protein
MTWNEFLPISMPMVAMVAIDLLDMAVLRLTLAPFQHHSPVGQEHGRTIPLGDIGFVSATATTTEVDNLTTYGITARRQKILRPTPRNGSWHPTLTSTKELRCSQTCKPSRRGKTS